MELKPKTDAKTQLVDMLNKIEGFNSSINYLGYKFNTQGIKHKADENPIDYRLSVNLSDSKIDKYKSRIKLSFDHIMRRVSMTSVEHEKYYLTV
mgnify:CR=1 FL=1